MITINDGELLKQASMTAHDYMYNAIKDIDKEMGEGYVKQHPKLIAAYMNVACNDFVAATQIKHFGELINNLTEAISSLRPI